MQLIRKLLQILKLHILQTRTSLGTEKQALSFESGHNTSISMAVLEKKSSFHQRLKKKRLLKSLARAIYCKEI